MVEEMVVVAVVGVIVNKRKLTRTITTTRIEVGLAQELPRMQGIREGALAAS